MKELSEKRLCREAVEVEAELDSCYSRIKYHDINDIKRRIEKGEVQVTNDNSLKKERTVDLSDGKILLHAEQWECMLNESARVTKYMPSDERRLLNYSEYSLYQGAICALHWLLGHHDEDLAVYLKSDHFKVSIAVQVAGNSVDE